MSPDQKGSAPANLPSEEPKHEEKKEEKRNAHAETSSSQEGEQKSNFFLNVLVVIALIVLAVILLWGLVNVASLSGSWFSSFTSSGQAVQITVAKTAPSNAPLAISWKTNTAASGSYSLVYQCGGSVRLALVRADNTVEPFACGAAFPMGSTTKAILLPTLTSAHAANLLLSVVFTSASGARQEGTATISITPPAAQTGTSQPTTGTQTGGGTTAIPIPVDLGATGPVHVGTGATTPTPAQTKPTTVTRPAAAVGSADLAVSIIAVGYIDPSSGALLMNRAPMPGDVVGVEFDIRNNGPRATGSWMFEAHLPTQSQYTYTSPVQKSLQPGDHIVNTLRFTMLAQGGGLFTVIADPSQQVSDPNRTNNEAAVSVY